MYIYTRARARTRRAFEYSRRFGIISAVFIRDRRSRATSRTTSSYAILVRRKRDILIRVIVASKMQKMATPESSTKERREEEGEVEGNRSGRESEELVSGGVSGRSLQQHRGASLSSGEPMSI